MKAMISRDALLIPGARSIWELWGQADAPMQRIDDPGLLNGQPFHFALSNDYCRSFPMLLPSKDRKLFRDMVQAQLEKRGCLPRSGESPQFDFELIEKQEKGALLRVDLVKAHLPEVWRARNVLSFAPSMQYFRWPTGHLVLVQELGRLVIVANRGGKFLYSAIVNREGVLRDDTHAEVITTALALEREGVIGKVEGIELWGEFPDNSVAKMKKALAIPVCVRPRPAPEQALRPRGNFLAKRTASSSNQRWRKGLIWAAAVVLLLGAYGFLVAHHYGKLKAVEAKIAAGPPASGKRANSPAKTEEATKRWKGLIDAIEPRRYPLVQLNRIAKIMPADGVILSKFQTKLTEVTIEGIANRPKSVFDFIDLLNQDEDLSAIYAWSRKEEPAVDQDGSARFQVIGKRKG